MLKGLVDVILSGLNNHIMFAVILMCIICILMVHIQSVFVCGSMKQTSLLIV